MAPDQEQQATYLWQQGQHDEANMARSSGAGRSMPPEPQATSLIAATV
jgi:hypothetical protein